MAIILASLPLLAAPQTSIPMFEFPKFNLPKVDLEPLRNLTAHRKLRSTVYDSFCNANTFASSICPLLSGAAYAGVSCADIVSCFCDPNFDSNSMDSSISGNAALYSATSGVCLPACSRMLVGVLANTVSGSQTASQMATCMCSEGFDFGTDYSFSATSPSHYASTFCTDECRPWYASIAHDALRSPNAGGCMDGGAYLDCMCTCPETMVSASGTDVNDMQESSNEACQKAAAGWLGDTCPISYTPPSPPSTPSCAKKDEDIGGIVGGAVGGVIGLAMSALLVWFVYVKCCKGGTGSSTSTSSQKV